MIAAHADVVGSLLRPAELLRAQRDRAAGKIGAERFRTIEDRAVDQAVALQESVGLQIVTDGEMRRESFQSQMTAAVSGFGKFTLDAFLWGEWQDESGTHSTVRPGDLGVVKKLRPRRYLSAGEFAYLKAKASRTPKITLPSPGLWVNFWSAERSAKVYPTLDAFFADIVKILRREVKELVRLRATYIQLDAPQYGLLVDPKTRPFYEQRGWTLDKWIGAGAEIDNAVMAGFPEITFGFHL